MDEKTFRKMRDISGRTDVPPSGFRPAVSGISAVQKTPDSLIAKSSEAVKRGDLPELPKLPKRVERPAEGVRVERPIAPLREQPRVREDVALRRGLKQEERVAARGAKAGERVGKARAKNIAEVRQEKSVRKEQLKSLRQGIEIRAKKDKIIQVLRNTGESTNRIKRMIVDHAKEKREYKEACPHCGDTSGTCNCG